MLGEAGRVHREHVVDQALGFGAGEELLRAGDLLQRLAGNRIPRADRGDLAGGERLRRFVRGGVDELHVGLLHAIGFERLEQQQVLHERDFDADFLALQILDRIDAGLADDHVAAFAVIEQGDDLALARRWRR